VFVDTLNVAEVCELDLSDSSLRITCGGMFALGNFNVRILCERIDLMFFFHPLNFTEICDPALSDSSSRKTCGGMAGMGNSKERIFKSRAHHAFLTY